MLIKIKGQEYNEAELAVLAKAGVLNIGEKHDTSATTPTAQALHGPFPGDNTQFGVFTAAGVRPGMFNATTRVESIGRYIPMMRSEFYNEIIEIMTGVTANPGTNQTNSCVVGPKPGDLKVCQQTYSFGIIHASTRIDDLTQIGMKKNRADIPREFYNQAAFVNPWLPQVPGIDGLSTSTSRLRAAMYTLGVGLERAISPVHFVGVAGTENNTYVGVARQWSGLDGLIKTGYTDAITNLACARADSTVVSFNALVSGTDANGRDVVETFSDTVFGLEDLGANLGMGDVQYALVMRPDLFRALTEVWACTYATYRCTDGDAGSPVNRDGMSIQQFRTDMFNNRYLLIDGVRWPVILDNTIARDVLGNNYYKSDIYIVALSWAGQPLLYAQYFPMDNAEALEYAGAFGGTDETSVINNGLYRVFRRNTGGCIEFDLFSRVRLILDAPFLSGRIDDIWYRSYYKQVDPIPGTSWHEDGGTSYRL